MKQRGREIRIKERIKKSKIIKSSVKAQIKFFIFYFLPFSYSAQPKVALHYSCGAKKYSFGSIIIVHILVFSGAKNNNIVI